MNWFYELKIFLCIYYDQYISIYIQSLTFPKSACCNIISTYDNINITSFTDVSLSLGSRFGTAKPTYIYEREREREMSLTMTTCGMASYPLLGLSFLLSEFIVNPDSAAADNSNPTKNVLLRHSVRIILHIILAAIWTPSYHSATSCRFVVAIDKETIRYQVARIYGRAGIYAIFSFCTNLIIRIYAILLKNLVEQISFYILKSFIYMASRHRVLIGASTSETFRLELKTLGQYLVELNQHYCLVIYKYSYYYRYYIRIYNIRTFCNYIILHIRLSIEIFLCMMLPKSKSIVLFEQLLFHSMFLHWRKKHRCSFLITICKLCKRRLCETKRVVRILLKSILIIWMLMQSDTIKSSRNLDLDFNTYGVTPWSQPCCRVHY